MSTDPTAEIRYIRERICILKQIINIQSGYRKIFFDEEKCSLKEWVPFDPKILKSCLSALRLEATLSMLEKLSNDPDLINTNSLEIIGMLDKLDDKFGDGGLDQIYIDHLQQTKDVKEEVEQDLKDLQKEMDVATVSDFAKEKELAGKIAKCEEVRDALASI